MTGLVDYQIETGNEGVLSGMTPGPVAAVPEQGELPAIFAVAAFLMLKRGGRLAQDLHAVLRLRSNPTGRIIERFSLKS